MKLLIVDDEPLIKTKLEQLIRNSYIGLHTILSTSDSVEAMEILKKDPPNLLLTDIKMPRITGVDLAKYIYENHLETLVIFITGYSDFEYAKSGIDYQVFDYLLKPLETDNALQSIKKAIDTLLEKQKHQDMYRLFQNYFSTHFTLAKQQFLEKLLFHPITQTTEQLLSIEKQFDMEANEFYLISITFSFQNTYGEEEFYYTHMIEQFLGHNHHDFLTYAFGNTIYVLWLIKGNSPSDTEMFQLFTEIKSELENIYPIFISIGISNSTKDLCQLQVLRKQVQRCQEYIRTHPSETITYFCDLPNTLVHEEYFDIINCITQLISYIRLGNKKEVKKEFTKITEQFLNHSDGYIEETMNLIVSNILLFIHDLPLAPTENEKIKNNIIIPLSQHNTTKQKIDYFEYWIDYITDAIKDAQSAEQSHLIQIIYDYIDKNYPDNIGLTTLSEYVNRNPSYLSRFIKQNTNKNFSQILTERRIEVAKNMLRNTNYKIPQIAEKVGYPNVRYFSRVFNTQVSMSPIDYRKITSVFYNN